jgi:hypothetical protein
VLEFLENWLDLQREKALLRAFAEWQNDPSRELGEFGLSVTTDVSSPIIRATGYVGIQFTLHHTSGAHYHSGTFRFFCASTPDDLDWLPDVAAPLLNEFLLPSGISNGYQPVQSDLLRLVKP